MWRAVAALVLLSAAACAQHQSIPKTSENDHLIQTAKIWITLKYFHPQIASNAVDWDKALIAALPNIRAAKSSKEYAAALKPMLDALHDDITAVLAPEQGERGFADYDNAGQRIWIHNGLPPESGRDDGVFYSAFAFRPPRNPPPSITVPLDDGFRVQLGLSDHAESNSAPPPKADSYGEGRYPSTEYRILAAFKTWGVIHYFFAYRDLMDEDWDDVLAAFLPRFIDAKDAREYNLAVADMLTHTMDSQVTVTSEELSDYFGRATVGLRLRLIEKKPVITQILDEQASSAGLRIGDIVASIDGEPIAARFNRIQDYVAGGTPQRRGYDSLQRVLFGSDGSTATLLVGTQDGPTKEVKLERRMAFADALERPQSTGNAIRILPENVGYVDLTTLPDDQVPAIFEKLQNARAIIFDARGETQRSGVRSPRLSDSAQVIASHLTQRTDAAGAIITGPVTLSPDILTANSLTSTASYFVVEKLCEPVSPAYKGKTVMLIDERTIRSGEHLGLWLDAANNTTFIGTASAGAEGKTSNFVLPGGITVTFSGQDVRHGNGGKLQRLGIQPTVLIAPTVNGIRQGRDEVLEGAIEYLTDSSPHRIRASNALQPLR